MDTIIRFLKDEHISSANKTAEVDISTKDVENIKNLFARQDIAKPSHLRIRPQTGKNQIWSIKSEYTDFLGNIQKSSHPLLVSIATDVDDIENEEFVRIFVISPFIEMGTEHDEICKDASVIGFPFLVETWNEQPLLTEILDSCLGYYEVNDSFSEQGKLNFVQKEFRKIEISRARYLNHSITALLIYLEEAKEHEFAVSISLSGNTQQLYYPKEKPTSNIFVLQEPPLEYLTATKSVISKKDKYIEYKPESLPFNIQIRKNDEGFILTITPICDIELLDRNNKIIKGRSNSEKTVFSSLKNGLYTLKSTKIQEPIKIRLK